MLCVYINICYNVDSTFNNSREHTGRKYCKLFIESLHDSNTLERQYSEKDQYSFDIVSISRPAFTDSSDIIVPTSVENTTIFRKYHQRINFIPRIKYLLYFSSSRYLNVLKLSPDIYITIFFATSCKKKFFFQFRKIKTFSFSKRRKVIIRFLAIFPNERILATFAIKCNKITTNEKNKSIYRYTLD